MARISAMQATMKRPAAKRPAAAVEGDEGEGEGEEEEEEEEKPPRKKCKAKSKGCLKTVVHSCCTDGEKLPNPFNFLKLELAQLAHNKHATHVTNISP